VTNVNRRDERRPYWRDEDESDMQDLDAEQFNERHRRFSDRVERFLMQVIILGLVALVLVQTVAVIPSVRKFTSLVEALEGVPAGDYLAWSGAMGDGPMGETQLQAAPVDGAVQRYSLTVILTNRRTAPDAHLLVDGRSAGSFAKPTLTVKVRRGQRVSVDGSSSPEKLTFRVVGAVGLTSPALGTTVSTQGDTTPLGQVR
jgi:hypothetical protein